LAVPLSQPVLNALECAKKALLDQVPQDPDIEQLKLHIAHIVVLTFGIFLAFEDISKHAAKLTMSYVDMFNSARKRANQARLSKKAVSDIMRFVDERVYENVFSARPFEEYDETIPGKIADAVAEYVNIDFNMSIADAKVTVENACEHDTALFQNALKQAAPDMHKFILVALQRKNEVAQRFMRECHKAIWRKKLGF